MKSLFPFAIASALLGCSSKHEDRSAKKHGEHTKEHQGHGHGHSAPAAGATLMVTTDPSPPQAGREARLRLMIHTADGAMVRAFDVAHEAKVHLAIVSEGLGHFVHLHPEVDSAGNLSIAHTFPAGGAYRLFADFTPAGGKAETATASVSVSGAPAPEAAPIPDAPGTVTADGLRATIAAEPLKAGAAARVRFTLRDEGRAPVALDTYMGALGHLMFIGVGSWRYVHVHPTGGDGAKGEVAFEAHFPEPGLYKGWGQFKHARGGGGAGGGGGRVTVVPFVVKVD